jgi:hypothetical protein
VGELGDAIEQIGDIEVQAQRKRRLQGRVKAIAARLAGHAPPGVGRIAFEREPSRDAPVLASRPMTWQPKRHKSLSGGGAR